MHFFSVWFFPSLCMVFDGINNLPLRWGLGRCAGWPWPGWTTCGTMALLGGGDGWRGWHGRRHSSANRAPWSTPIRGWRRGQSWWGWEMGSWAAMAGGSGSWCQHRDWWRWNLKNPFDPPLMLSFLHIFEKRKKWEKKQSMWETVLHFILFCVSFLFVDFSYVLICSRKNLNGNLGNPLISLRYSPFHVSSKKREMKRKKKQKKIGKWSYILVFTIFPLFCWSIWLVLSLFFLFWGVSISLSIVFI